MCAWVLPNVKYPDIPFFTESEQDCNPLKNKVRLSLYPIILSPSIQPVWWFTSHHTHCSSHITSMQPCMMTAFSIFSRTNFQTLSNREVYTLKLDSFTCLVCQWEVDTVVTRQSGSMFQMTCTEIVAKTPVYYYCGHIYYLSMWILPFYWQSLLEVDHQLQISEVLPLC